MNGVCTVPVEYDQAAPIPFHFTQGSWLYWGLICSVVNRIHFKTIVDVECIRKIPIIVWSQSSVRIVVGCYRELIRQDSCKVPPQIWTSVGILRVELPARTNIGLICS